MTGRARMVGGMAAAGLVAILLFLPLGLNTYGLFILSMWAVMSIAAMGLNLTLGYAGQVSLAQGAFVGIGAYTAALLTINGYSLALAFVVAALLCFAVGWLLGYPALRVQHHYLAFVTLAFSTLAYLVFRNEEWLTKGIYGISGVPRPAALGIDLAKPLPFYYFCLAVLAVVVVAMWWLVKSPWGRAFVAIRENLLRARSLGVNTSRYTLLAFAIGSGLGGIAGALYAPLAEFVDPSPFTLLLSLNLLMMVIVGGSGYFAGPLLGAIIAVLLPEWLRAIQNYYLILYALLVMAILMWSPTGILGIADAWLERRRSVARSRALAEKAPTLASGEDA